jgi:hypothetical protein
MLIASKNDGAPFTLAVMGASFTFTPITRPMIMRARRMARPVLADSEGGDDLLDEFGSAVSHSLLMEGMIGWGDVALPVAEGEDAEGTIGVDGQPYRLLDCTPENKALLFADPVVFDALDAAYVAPFVTRTRELAKNAPAGSSDGISSRVTPAPDTAASPAAGESGAASARTGKKRSRTKRSSSPSTR